LFIFGLSYVFYWYLNIPPPLYTQGRAERFFGGGCRTFSTSMKNFQGGAFLLQTKGLGGGQPPSTPPPTPPHFCTPLFIHILKQQLVHTLKSWGLMECRKNTFFLKFLHILFYAKLIAKKTPHSEHI